MINPNMVQIGAVMERMYIRTDGQADREMDEQMDRYEGSIIIIWNMYENLNFDKFFSIQSIFILLMQIILNIASCRKFGSSNPFL